MKEFRGHTNHGGIEGQTEVCKKCRCEKCKKPDWG
jgi:predicted metal-binding protein